MYNYGIVTAMVRKMLVANTEIRNGYHGLRILDVADQTEVEYEARRRIVRALAFARANLPGFQRAALVDTAPQLGVRQTRLLQGEYVLTRDDVLRGRWFPDRVGRGRDYYYPYRVMLPLGVENLLVAGRCFSATAEAQRMSREIPPMMVLGQAAGIAAAATEVAAGRPEKAELPAAPRPVLDKPVPAEPPGVPGDAGRPATRALAKPLVRKLAKDLGIDLAVLAGAGSGPDGSITRDDVHRAATTEPPGRSAQVGNGGRTATPATAASPGGEGEHAAALIGPLERLPAADGVRPVRPQDAAGGVHVHADEFAGLLALEADAAAPGVHYIEDLPGPRRGGPGGPQVG